MDPDHLSTSVQFLGIAQSLERENVPVNVTQCHSEPSVEELVAAEVDSVLPPGYSLSRIMAEGAMGSVFLIVNAQKQDHLAMKAVKISNCPGLRDEIKREGNLQRRLQHPNIAAVYGARNSVSFAYVFMELLPGGDLFDNIPVGRGLNIQRMFEYYSQILDALEFLHNKQVVHLDIKPENIMISGRKRAKLIDFGWAVDLCQKGERIMGPVGTAGYAAPETFGKLPFRGQEADLFSLGVTLLTGVTGQRCWLRADLKSDQHYSDWVNRVKLSSSPLFSRLSPGFIHFIMFSIAHNPRERLTIDGIRGHAWFKMGLKKRLDPVVPANTAKPVRAPKRPCPDLSLGPDLDSDGENKKHFEGDTVATGLPVATFHSNFADLILPLSQPVGSSSSRTDSPARHFSLTQPTYTNTMALAKNAVYSSDAVDTDRGRLGFACIMRRMTRFFSNQMMEESMQSILSVIRQLSSARALRHGADTILVQIRINSAPETNFRMCLYPLAKAILVDCRRISGDGLLFHETYQSIYGSLLEMKAIDDSHPYLHMVLPDPVKPLTGQPIVQNHKPSSGMLDETPSDGSEVRPTKSIEKSTNSVAPMNV